ncbi:MAG TPA: hypothetical protein PLL36_10545 [Candidatus Hydrogenedentes bacterium]|nr:MAG: hypothetical protein BWY09_01542 [Candidatus Hydrogenedentes bacterium ADurb.Bin179]HQN01507.1 hypothetical protein [Candidatus Hydrogenedentota bacterium]
MKRNGIIAVVLVVMLASVSCFAQVAENLGNEEREADSYLSADKDDQGMELDVRLCGCRVIRQPSGAVTGKVCGCTVVDLSKGDFFIVASAMMGLLALSARKK